MYKLTKCNIVVKKSMLLYSIENQAFDVGNLKKAYRPSEKVLLSY
jgi:hypothetical protein